MPYGWTLAADGIHLEPDPAEQEILAAARELRAEGLSLRKIGAELVRRGLLSRSGKTWNPKSVRALLRAEAA